MHVLVQNGCGSVDAAVRSRDKVNVKPLCRVFLKLCNQLGISCNRYGRIGCTGRIVKTGTRRLISGAAAADIPTCEAVIGVVRGRRQASDQAAERRACTDFNLLGCAARHGSVAEDTKGYVCPDRVIRIVRHIDNVNGSARKETESIGLRRHIRN